MPLCVLVLVSLFGVGHKKSLKCPFKGLYGHLSRSCSIFKRITFSSVQREFLSNLRRSPLTVTCMKIATNSKPPGEV